jgi:transcription initiation factor TFIIIB Brf1 subunit/transcription initiation factor TFIIB
MDELNFFNSLKYLEPRCPKCNIVLDYGVNTEFDEKKKSHICMKCGAVIT